MLFNTIEFLLFFVVVLTVILIIKNRKFQHLWLLGSSYFFFYFSSNFLLSLLIISTILDYFVAKEIWKAKTKKKKQILLILSLSGNLALLGFFKYADFAILQFNIFGNILDLKSSIPILNIALPIGISFYTFQTISYTVDVYRGLLKPSKSFWEFALFVSFFPQLVAGPIVRARDFLPQLREKFESNDISQKLRQIVITNRNLKLGLTIMTFGFFKKMFFADNIAPLVNEIFSNPIGLNSYHIIFATIGFGVQIYADFSGYSDIAIGIALILGFHLPKNFNNPYFATSPSDFWLRWHISLSSWLRDYLYIPLGGNKISQSRTYQNLITVMILGGLWHGASWNFIIWGALHGLYLTIHRIISNKFPHLHIHPFFKSKLGKIVSIIVMQYFVFLAWIPFRVQDFNDIVYSMHKYIFFDFNTSEFASFLLGHKLPIALIFLFILLNFIMYMRSDIIQKISKLPLKYWVLVLITIFTGIISFYNGNPSDFIYFRF
jgi:alginate O-acetyltransferase complex protein AlgI